MEDEDDLKLFAVKTDIVKSGDDLAEIALDALKRQKLQLEENDVLAFTSKIVSIVEGRTAKLSDIKPSGRAKKLARQFDLTPAFAELILQEADKVYGGVKKAVLTLKSGILTPNAGIDSKNAPEGSVVLWPSNLKKTAKNIRDRIKTRTGKLVGVLIVDSGLVPLRIGTSGLALAVAGFRPINDARGKKDFYGKPITITRHAVADDLASAAHLLMGETTEKTPIVLVRYAPVDFDDSVCGGKDMMIPPKECIFMGAFMANSRG